MYKDLGIHWASSIPAFLAVACVPFPFLFYRYGEKIRAKCKYTSEASNVLQQIMAKHQADAGGHGDENGMAEIELERTRSSAYPH